MKDIELYANGQKYVIPNSWDSLDSDTYIELVSNLLLMSSGQISAGEVRIKLLCSLMHWSLEKFKDDDAVASLLVLSEQLTFLFTINYPNPEILSALNNDDREKYLRTDPYSLNTRYADILKKQDYKYVVDLCFASQLIPELKMDGKLFKGYDIDTSFNTLTCSLTALQYIEARSIDVDNIETLPLLAAILYYPRSKEYDSGYAHRLAKKFSGLSAAVLFAISFNFQAFNNFLFTKTEFSLLTKFKPQPDKSITTDASDALYELSKDGLGDAKQIEQMNLITYLRVLRKNTISAVKSLSGIGLDKLKISTEVGLPINIIDNIL